MKKSEERKIVIFFALTTCYIIKCAAHKEHTNGLSSKLLIISFDGFRWDYLQKTNTPNFDKFLRGGVHARLGLKNAFVTNTFPNHFTLVTGMWENIHGIINNEMYDPVLNETFAPWMKKALSDPAWFSVGAEPIWVTNQLQKPNGRSGVIMWVGADAPIKWVQPSRFIPFNESIKEYDKVDTLIKWFTDQYPINLGLLYSMQPDEDGHVYGPDSTEVMDRIAQLDEVVGYLLDQLERHHLLEDLNIIITSDHGFSSTPKEKEINLDAFIDASSYMITGLSPVANIWPKEGKIEEIFQNLTRGASHNGHFIVYKKEDIPDTFHYKYNRRIPPILAVAENHFSFSTEKEPWSMLGDHGYSNSYQDMHPFFLAMGPSFKKGYSVDTFNSVDVYSLMCHLLQLRPAPNNGSMSVVKTLLLEQEESTSMMTFMTYLIGGLLVSSVASIFMFGVCRYRRYLSSQKRFDYSHMGVRSNLSTFVGSTMTRELSSPEKVSSIFPLMSDSD